MDKASLREKAFGDGQGDLARGAGAGIADQVNVGLCTDRELEFAKIAGRVFTYIGWLSLVLTAFICVLPVVLVVVGSFSEGNIFNDFHPSLAPWGRALDSTQTLASIKYSLLLTLRVPVGLAISFLLAWYIAMNDIYGKRTIMYVLWVAFFLPILPATLGWILLLDPHYGIINKYFGMLAGGNLLNIYSLAGITWLHLTLSTIPIMVILIEPAQRFIDASYEEASTMSGAGTFTTLRRVTIPLIAPTLLTALIAALIKALEAFEVEQLLGVPAGILVYSTRVFNLLGFVPPDEPQAMALSTFFLLALFALVVCYRFFLHRFQMTATLTGKGARLLAKERTWKANVFSAFMFVLLAITVLLPFSMALLSSFSKLFGFFNFEHPWTFAHWQNILESPAFISALRQSILIGTVVATFGTLLYLMLAWFIARNSFPGKSALSLAIWLPWALPGVLLGTAFLTVFLNVPALRVLHGTIVALVVVLVVQGMPFATHLFEASISQMSRELEESSLVSGAGRIETAMRILVPLIAPMVASVVVISFMAAMKDISATVLVATAGTQTLPLLMFSYATTGSLEEASVVGVITVVIALLMALIVINIGEGVSVSREPRNRLLFLKRAR
jgi:iron(III) transport system permease protein